MHFKTCGTLNKLNSFIICSKVSHSNPDRKIQADGISFNCLVAYNATIKF